jgi:hypothetical protein
MRLAEERDFNVIEVTRRQRFQRGIVCDGPEGLEWRRWSSFILASWCQWRSVQTSRQFMLMGRRFQKHSLTQFKENLLLNDKILYFEVELFSLQLLYFCLAFFSISCEINCYNL